MDENMQLNNSSIVFKNMCPGISYTNYFNVDGLCTCNKLVVQKKWICPVNIIKIQT